ncbi:SDR family oxidoreductase [Verrucomicrobiota bacterium]
MDYLVTGGAGFIGSNIVRRLLDQGQTVRVLDDLSTGRIENLDGVRDGIDFIEGDIRSAGTVAAAVNGVTNVLQLAALPSVVRSVEDPVKSNDVNVCGTLAMLVAARDAGVKRFVFSSSSSVYGDTEVLPKQEDMKPMPLSPYAAQKLMGEHYCRIFHSLYGLETFVLRYFNVFGPRQNPASQYAAVIPLFIEALRSDRAPVIYGDGGQTRDFTYVDDIVKANICCCAAPAEGAGGVYNVARGDRVSVNKLAETLMSIMGKDMEPRHEAARPGDVRDSQADSIRARSILGWDSETMFDEGLRKTVEYFCR